MTDAMQKPPLLEFATLVPKVEVRRGVTVSPTAGNTVPQVSKWTAIVHRQASIRTHSVAGTFQCDHEVPGYDTTAANVYHVRTCIPLLLLYVT